MCQGCSHFHIPLRKDVLPRALTRLLAGFWVLWAVALRTSVLCWQLFSRAPSVSCHLDLVTAWQREPEKKQESKQGESPGLCVTSSEKWYPWSLFILRESLVPAHVQRDGITQEGEYQEVGDQQGPLVKAAHHSVFRQESRSALTASVSSVR